MTLTLGSSCGPYRITERIGQGGMGEVFKAHDARLGRDVALKVSTEAFSDRFTREARAIAALNHTNICHLYDVGPDYLVMEFVEGATLQGPMSFDEALPIIGQLVDAIEAAHERNIVHRDLKPANIKITPDGVVKILDFGLAKALAPEGAGATADLTQSPTITSPDGMTGVGAILGTAAYMSPEQARGKPTDRRADIWAFGVIVYELLTGRQLFEGETAVEILGQVLHKMPDLSAAPPRARRLLEWCLEKDRKDRLQAIGDARRLLRDVSPAVAPVPPVRSWLNRAGWGVAGIAFLALALVIWRGDRSAHVEQPFMHLSVPLPGDASTSPSFLALSPDGRMLIIVPPRGGLIVRALDSSVVRTLAGTQGARTPFWSPDSKRVAFFADNMLKTVPASGGPAQSLCDQTGYGLGGTWSRNGVILLVTEAGALKRVQADGGACDDVLKAEPGLPTRWAVPVFLPDGDHFVSVKGGAGGGLFVASLENPEGQRLIADKSSGEFVPDSPTSTAGHLLFVREGTLMAQPFDSRSLQLSGEPFTIAQQVGFTVTFPQIAASASRIGTIAFVTNGRPVKQLIWYDRSGSEVGRAAVTGSSGHDVSLAPDGRSVVFGRADDQNPSEVRLLDLQRNQESRFLAPPFLAPPFVAAVVWSADSSRVAFAGAVDGTSGIYARNVSGGTAELLFRHGENTLAPSDWSQDGRSIVYTESDPKTVGDIWLLPVSPSPGAPVPLVRTTANESQGQISPDGKWLAYYSNESGVGGVYLRGLSKDMRVSDAVLTVSAAGALEPRWRADGRELFYLEGVPGTRRFKLVAVSIGDASDNPLGTPRPLFEFATINFQPQNNAFSYSPYADGQRFLVNAFATDPQPSLDVLINWPASLTK